MPRIFAYGTLGFPEIVHALTGRRFASRTAVLDGFARYRVRGRIYPDIVPAPDSRTAGVLWGRAGFAARHLGGYRAHGGQLRRATTSRER